MDRDTKFSEAFRSLEHLHQRFSVEQAWLAVRLKAQGAGSQREALGGLPGRSSGKERPPPAYTSQLESLRINFR
jgi:hypothetical protein